MCVEGRSEGEFIPLKLMGDNGATLDELATVHF
jgi:hypothetical protein